MENEFRFKPVWTEKEAETEARKELVARLQQEKKNELANKQAARNIAIAKWIKESKVATAICMAFIIITCPIWIYLLPTFEAKMRKHPLTDSIFVINLFFGWTLIGWVVAMSMAVGKKPVK